MLMLCCEYHCLLEFFILLEEMFIALLFPMLLLHLLKLNLFHMGLLQCVVISQLAVLHMCHFLFLAVLKHVFDDQVTHSIIAFPRL
jgi:hypothetical protein